MYEPNNGISLIMDILRSSLNAQQCPGMVFSEKQSLNGSHNSNNNHHPGSANRNNIISNRSMKTRDRQFMLKRAMVSSLSLSLFMSVSIMPDLSLLTFLTVDKNYTSLHPSLWSLSTTASCLLFPAS